MVGVSIVEEYVNDVSREFDECTILFVEVPSPRGSKSLYQGLIREPEEMPNLASNSWLMYSRYKMELKWGKRG